MARMRRALDCLALACWVHEALRHELLHRPANMVRAQMRVPLHHRLRLPASGALERVKIHAAHRQSGRECVAQVVKAEVWNASRLERRAPGSLKVVQFLPSRPWREL